MPFFGGFEILFLLFPIVLLGIVVLGIVALARRGDADGGADRPQAVYLIAVMFVTLFVAFGGVAQGIGTLAQQISGELPPGYDQPHRAVLEPEVGTSTETEVGFAPGGGIPAPIPPDTSVDLTVPASGWFADLLRALIVAGIAAFVFVFHRRRLEDLLRAERGLGAHASVRRMHQVYAYAVAFVAVLVVLVSATLALFGLVDLAFAGSGAGAVPPFFERGFAYPGGTGLDRGLAELLEHAAIGALASWLFLAHWRLGTRLREELAPRPPDAPAEGA